MVGLTTSLSADGDMEVFLGKIQWFLQRLGISGLYSKKVSWASMLAWVKI